MPSLKSIRQGVTTQLGVGFVSIYDSLGELPITNITQGDAAYVKNVNNYYISDGSGWRNTTLANKNPYWEIEPGDSDQTIVDSATPLIIIAKANDSDNPNLVNQSVGTDSAQYMVDVTNDSSVFTFTPKTKLQVAEAVTAGNLTSVEGDFTYTFKWSDGINFVSKAVNITYNAVDPGTPANFTISSSSPLLGWNYGEGNPNNNKTTYAATTKITNLLTNKASGTSQPDDPEYEVILSATGGSGGTPVIGWHRINNPRPASTTYRVYSYQAMGRAYSNTNQTGQQVIHAWDITVPQNGALFVRPGQNGAAGKWGNGVNQSVGPGGSYQHGISGGTGGVGQIMIYDPSVTTGTIIDGVRTNSILAITSTKSGHSGGNGANLETISASTGFMPYYSTAGTVNIIVQGRVNPFVARVAALGGYPNGQGTAASPRSDNGYTSTYVTPVNDWDGSEIGLGSGAVAGTNYYLGDRSAATYQASQNGKFVFVSGAIVDGS